MRIRWYNLTEPLEPSLDGFIVKLTEKEVFYFLLFSTYNNDVHIRITGRFVFVGLENVGMCFFFSYGLHFCCDSLPPWQIRNISALTFSINIGLLRNISHRTLMGLSHVVSGLDCLSTGVILKKTALRRACFDCVS